jgi:putative heme-binding domain-containing protein
LLQKAIGKRLERVTGQAKLGTDRQAWTGWFSTAYPKLAARLSNPDGVDVAAWEKRLARLDWSDGDAARGKAVFVKASCAACHSGTQALGPDLSGVAGRFSRADLFTAILQPSRDVSPRYQTTVIETTEGKIYQGLVIYEAVDGLILQTGAATTVRIAGEQLGGRRASPTSLMPAGLLDGLPDREIVDLYVYLRSLGTPAGKGKRAP